MKKTQSKHGRTEYTKGQARHRRSSADYLSATLDAVSVEDWTDIIAAAVGAAKMGDAQARSWLSNYLIGRAAAPAPTPLTVTVQQWMGTDPVSAEIARQEAFRQSFAGLHETQHLEEAIREAVSVEIESKLVEIKSQRKTAQTLAFGKTDNINDVDFDN